MLTLRAVFSSGTIVEQKFVYGDFDDKMNTLFAKFAYMVTDNTIFPGDVLVSVEWLDASGEVLFRG